MADADREEMINQFVDVTGVTTDRAKFYLEAANWTVQLALASFYEPENGGNSLDQEIGSDDNDADESSLTDGLASAMPFLPVPPSSSDTKVKVANSDKKSKPQVTSFGGPRIATIHNMTKSDEEDEDEQGQAFYTGTARSGQQILGPPKRNPIKDYVSEVFRSAQESGAEIVEQPHSSSGPSVFVGTGYRLGQTDNDHMMLPDQSRQNRRDNIEPVILKLWRQGFSINDGELRPYEEPANKEFLERIMKGEIPQELRQKGGSMVHVDLEDHRHEEFVKIIPKITPFSGKGHTLGSPAPVVADDATATQQSADVIAQNERRAVEQLTVDSEQPTTMIQVRLLDSSRISARFNHSHTVADIRNYIISARPQYEQQNFVLLTTFPSREIADETQTIAKAGLLNAAIMLRLK